MLLKVIAAAGMIGAGALLLTGCVGGPSSAEPDCPELGLAAFDLTASDEVTLGDSGIAGDAGLTELIDPFCFYSISSEGGDRGIFFAPGLDFGEAEDFMDDAESLGDDNGFTTLDHGPIRTGWGMNSANDDTGAALAILYFEEADEDVLQGVIDLEQIGIEEGDPILIGLIIAADAVPSPAQGCPDLVPADFGVPGPTIDADPEPLAESVGLGEMLEGTCAYGFEAEEFFGGAFFIVNPSEAAAEAYLARSLGAATEAGYEIYHAGVVGQGSTDNGGNDEGVSVRVSHYTHVDPASGMFTADQLDEMGIVEGDSLIIGSFRIPITG